MGDTAERDPDAPGVAPLTTDGEITPPLPVLAEFERLRRRLGFTPVSVPEIDGRYRLERSLGHGGMGEVHLARDLRLERDVALKLVRARPGTDRDHLQARLEREALALARIDHANVVGIHDVGTHEGMTYVTMQYVQGVTLREWQQRDGREPSELIDAYLQAARGLAAAHAGGVVHRDFKPDNVMVGDDGQVRVLDFGIAAALGSNVERSGSSGALGEASVSEATDEGTASETTADMSLTATRALVGTLPYMSPEQLAGRRADARSDQFGLCVAFWEALARERPFAAGSVGERQRSIDLGPKGGLAIPRWLRSILVRGLARDPSARWPDLDHLIDAIEAVRARRRRLGIGVGVSAALASALLVGHLLTPDPPPPPPARSCEAFVAAIDESWSARARAQLEGAAEVDAASATYVVATLDRLAAGWRESAEALCEGALAPAVDAPERVCLEAWLDSFADAINLLTERGDAKTLARAPDLLARLEPPNQDYCALRPSRAVDPKVARLAERAKAWIVLGDTKAGMTEADEALDRAEGLDDRPYSPERAAAHAAKAEVAAFSGQRELALSEFSRAQQHALASDAPELLLPLWTLYAKVLALGGDAEQAALALGLVDQAEPLGFALHLGVGDPRRTQLLEARGWGERGRGHYREALALHRAAAKQFTRAGQPILAGTALVNVAANHQELGELELARAAYAEALAVFDEVALPPSYRNRIAVEHDLGLLAYNTLDPSDDAAGIAHLEHVVEHGDPTARRSALELIIAIAAELDDRSLGSSWAERALSEIEAHPDIGVAERVRLRRAAGLTLARDGDPRGEALLELAAAEAETLDPKVDFNLQRTWVQWLESEARCDEARARRAAVIARLDSVDPKPPGYPEWRENGPEAACATTPN